MEFDENDSSWYELINGELVRKQSPTISHQNISGNLYFRIRLFLEEKPLGKVLSAPLGVVLDDGNAYPGGRGRLVPAGFVDNLQDIIFGKPNFKIISKCNQAH